MNRILFPVIGALLVFASPAWAQTGTVAFSVSSYTVNDTDASALITVVFSGSTNGSARVDFRTVDGSARAGIEYTATTGTLTYAVGELTNAFDIPLLSGGGLLSNETINVVLSNPTGPVTLGSPSNAVVTILSTVSSEVNFTAPHYGVVRRVGSATVRVSRTGDSSGEARVDFLTFDDTAVSGVDYLPTNGTLIFRPGESQKSFSFAVFDTPTFDVNRTVIVQLENVQGGSLGTLNAAEVLLINDKTQTITFTTDDSDAVTMTLKYAGTMETTDAQPPFDILLSGTDESSVLTIKIKKGKTGDGLIDVGAITGEGGCRIIDARGVDITGDGVQLGEHLGNLRVHDILNGAPIFAGGDDTQRTRITAHEIEDTAIAIGSRLGLTAARFGAGSIDAPSADNISIRGDKKLGIPGDFEAQVTLTGDGVSSNQFTLGRLAVAGTILGVSIDVLDGSVGSVGAGNMIDSTVTVGFIPDDLLTVLDGGEFTPELRLQAVNIRADFLNSSLVAAQVGAVRLGTVTPDNGGVRFGVLADESIGSVSVKTPAYKWQRTGPADQTLGDFHVIH